MTDTAVPRTTTLPLNGPHPDEFPQQPAGWTLFCHEDELRAGPVTRELLGRKLVAFRTSTGEVSILDARCSHLGADLGQGEVHGECLRCPFHHWEYGADGRCVRIPAQDEIPAFARQRVFPVGRLGPCIFVYPARQAPYSLPFFSGENVAHFTASAPYSFTVNCPWYFIGANAFDTQHFASAHDRVLESGPLVDSPSAHARRAISHFRVAGGSWRDMVTRLVSGPNVTLTTTDYGGLLLLATAKFRRTTSYGMLSVVALEPSKTQVNLVVWIPRSRTALGRATLDRLHLPIRSYFIRQFLAADAIALRGCSYHPRRLIAADGVLTDYFRWLAETHRCHEETPNQEESIP